MSEITLQSESICTNTIVPDLFIDHYMANANGEFVKVYLYLLRCVHSRDCQCTVSAIADRVNHTENDVVRALNYWEKQGLIALTHDADKTIRQICLLSLEKESAPERESTPARENALPKENTLPIKSAQASEHTFAMENDPAANDRTWPQKRDYSLDEIQCFRKDPDISELLFVAETYMKRPLSPGDINTVLYWHEELHFPTDLIVYLIEYCISKGHSSMRYLNKVALGWNEKGISTVEQAKEEAAIHSQAYYGVMKALGITGRSLIQTETAFIRKWTKEYGFDLPLIQEACSRTMTAIHQPSFEYADKILTSWHKNHVHTMADVQKLDAAHSQTRKVSVRTADAPAKKTAFNNFNQRSYDYDKLEELLLTTSLHG